MNPFSTDIRYRKDHYNSTLKGNGTWSNAWNAAMYVLLGRGPLLIGVSIACVVGAMLVGAPASLFALPQVQGLIGFTVAAVLTGYAAGAAGRALTTDVYLEHMSTPHQSSRLGFVDKFLAYLNPRNLLKQQL